MFKRDNWCIALAKTFMFAFLCEMRSGDYIIIPSASFGNLGPLKVTGKLKNKTMDTLLLFSFAWVTCVLFPPISILSDFQSVFLHMWKKAFFIISWMKTCLSSLLWWYQTNETGTFSQGEDKKRTSAVFRSVNELVCPLPTGQSTGSYLITITNDNTLFSSPATLIVYDSRCFSCSASDSSCVQKVGSYWHIQKYQ